MVDDAFKLTLDKIFVPPEGDSHQKQIYHVEGYDDHFNMWYLFFTHLNFLFNN